MSFHLITIEELMQLPIPTLKFALRLFEKELAGTLAFLAEEPEARNDDFTLDDLCQLHTLRKVFKIRLKELEAEFPDGQGGEPAAVFADVLDYSLAV